MKGRILWFSRRLGYGLIRPQDGGAEVLFRRDDLDGLSEDVAPETAIEFDCEVGSGPAERRRAHGVRRATPASETVAPAQRSQQAPRAPVFVANLPFETTKAQLRELFAAAGCEVLGISFPPSADPKTRFGIVKVPQDQAEAAVARLDGQPFAGRTLRVRLGKQR